MSEPAAADTRVLRHFSENARAFDQLYAHGRLQRLLRPSLWQRQLVALEVVKSFSSPTVLDVGCGPGRLAAEVLASGARRYVGVDFAGPMLALARERLRRFGDRIALLEQDYNLFEAEEPFDVVLGLGLFDYLERPEAVARRMRAHCRGAAVATFPRWTWVRGSYRAFRYRVVHDCPIFNYDRRGIERLLTEAGFRRVTFRRANYVFVVVAEP
jgi:SAM-dependent methyltransferase